MENGSDITIELAPKKKVEKVDLDLMSLEDMMPLPPSAGYQIMPSYFAI